MELADVAGTLDDKQLADALLRESRGVMEHSGGAVCCRHCERPILRPEDLVRYFGANLHDKCFVEVYETDRDTCHVRSRREYFERVLKVVKNRNKKEFDFTT